MNRPMLLTLVLGVAVAMGCSASGGETGMTEETRPLGPGTEVAGDAAAPAVSNPGEVPQAREDWDTLIRRLRQNYEVQEQQAQAQAGEHYKLAERYFQSGDFQRAEIECGKAIQLDPDHAAAQALMTEIRFLRNRGPVGPEFMMSRQIMRDAVVRHEQLLAEIEKKISDGQRSYNLANYDDAEQHFRTILEYAKWMPTGPGIDARRKEALEWLERTKNTREQQRIDEAIVRRQRMEEERIREEQVRIIEKRREIELLIGKARELFEMEDYKACARMCDRILYLDPRLGSVQDMKMVSQRLRHQKLAYENRMNYIEQWKRTFEKIERNAMLASEIYAYPDREIWEKIRIRQPKGIQKKLEEDMDPQDKEISEKLKAIRITIDMQDAPLTAVVDYIREISGLNFVIDSSISDPESELITIKVNEIVLDGALTLMLHSRDMAHIVEGGVVLITMREQMSSRLRLELYDIQDITVAIQDFPGVDITLAEDDFGAAFSMTDAEPVSFTGDDLSDLIQVVIDPDGWMEEGRSILHQNGILIVNNTVQTHRKIRKFLTDLRASTGIMINVEARFLSVEDTWIQEVGMDFRDLDGARQVGIADLDDINPAFVINPMFIDPDGAGALTATSAGFGYSGGNSITRDMGGRVQNIMLNDFINNRFYPNTLNPVGGATLQYTLLDDISLEAILRLVSRSERAHTLAAPSLTLFNTQRGNMRFLNQFAYIRDYEIQMATLIWMPDPVMDVVHDGISFDVRPIVSADRRYVTMELRPTFATMVPPLPNIAFLMLELEYGTSGGYIAPPVRIETPVLEIQRLRTTVMIPDRGTLLLGGLTVYYEIDAESSVPVWRHVPILGRLGSHMAKGRLRRQLLMLCRPQIIIPNEEESLLFD